MKYQVCKKDTAKVLDIETPN